MINSLRSRRHPPHPRLRVLDAGVVQGDQALAQALLDQVQLGQRQAALLKLAVEQAFHEEFVAALAAAGNAYAQAEAAAASALGVNPPAAPVGGTLTTAPAPLPGDPITTLVMGGSGTPIDVPDNSVLAFEVKQSSSFKNADQQFEQYAKQQLGLGQQSDIDISNGLHLIHFNQSLIPDLRLGFGGTQGLDVRGSGYQENGRYVGTITYTIRDVYGFYAKDKFLGVGPKMHYLQGVCGAPDYKGGAHYYKDSVTVTVPFNQPIN